MLLRVDENPNCESVEGMRFKTVGPPRKIFQVKLYDDDDSGSLCCITGWSDNRERPVCPAYAQKVEDSGDGEAYLIFGGPWGLRLKPQTQNEEKWSLSDSRQWGEPFLILNDANDIIFLD